MTLLFFRFFLAFLLLSPFLFMYIKKNGIQKDHIRRLFIAGFFLIVLNNGLGYTGLFLSTAIDASILGLLLPVLSVVIGWLFFKEKILRINLIGILFGLTGGLLIISTPLIFAELYTSTRLLGNLLIIISGIFVVFGFSLAKELLRLYPPLVQTGLFFGIGALCFLFPAMNDYVQNPTWVEGVDFTTVAGVAYVAILATVAAYLLVIWGLRKAGVTQANLFHYIQPCITASVAIPVLGETISPMFLVSAVLVILGVYWGTVNKESHHHMFHRHHRL